MKSLLKADILLAASGPALALSVFLVPKSGVVEVMPANYRNDFYHDLALSSGLYYLSHVNFTGESVEASEEDEVYIPPITLTNTMCTSELFVNYINNIAGE